MGSKRPGGRRPPPSQNCDVVSTAGCCSALSRHCSHCHLGASRWLNQWRGGCSPPPSGPLGVLLFISRALCRCRACVFQPAPPLFCSTLIRAGRARAGSRCLLSYPLRSSREPSDLSLKHFYYVSLQISFLYDRWLLIFFVSLSILNRGWKAFALAEEVMIFSAKNPVVSYRRNFIRITSEAANGGCRICNKHVSWD